MTRKGNNRNQRVQKSPKSGALKEKTFPLNYFSVEEQRRYQGIFTVKRPTMLQSLEIEGNKSTMLGGKYYDPRNPGCGIPPMAAMLAEMMSFLQICVVEGPDWWEGGDGDFSDPKVVWEVYREAQEVDPFRERVEFLARESGEESSEGSVGGDREAGDFESDDAEPSDDLAEMVD